MTFTERVLAGRARVLLAVLAVPHLYTGLWAVFSPRGWFDDFPGVGPALVAGEPPFNAHLASDAGAGFVAVGVALLAAAIAGRRAGAVVAGAAALALGVPHLVFHLRHPSDGLSTAANVVDVIVLAGSLVAVGLVLRWAVLDPTRHAAPMPSRPAPREKPARHFRSLRTLGRYIRAMSRAKRNRSDFLRWLVRRPQLLLANGLYETALMFSNRCYPRLKELAELKAAAIVSCEFCLDIGSALVHYSGVTEQQILDLPRFRDSDAYSELEKLVLELAEAMTRVPVDVPPELREQLLTHLSRGQYAELAAVIAWENQRGRVFQALGVRPTGMAEGMVCALPERPATAAAAVTP